VDQRRFIAFLALAMAVMILSSKLFPPVEQPKPKQPPAGAPANGAAADAANGANEREKGGAEAGAAQNAPAAALPAVGALEVAADTVPRQLVTLGSLEVDSGYRMLVTLTNQGAAVQRVELASSRFRDLQDRSGYLGQLGLEAAAAGAKVNVVGPGTPAAAAGIEAGDVISEVTLPKQPPKTVKTVDDFQAALATSEPGQEISLQVARGSDPAKAVTVRLTRRPFNVIRPEIENIRLRNAEPPAGFVDRPSFLVGMASIGGKAIAADANSQLTKWLTVEGHGKDDPEYKELTVAAQLDKYLAEGNWEIAQHDASSVTFVRSIPDLKLKLVKRFTLAAVPAGSRSDENYPAYNLQLDLEVKNAGDTPQSVAYRLDGPTGLPLEGWWYAHKISQRWFATAGLRDVAVRSRGSAEIQIDATTIADDKAEPLQGGGLAYIGVDGLYFASILIPKKESLDEDMFDTIEAIRVGPKPDAKTLKTFTNVTCRLTRKVLQLAAGQSQRDSYQVFVGPKFPELLAEYQAEGDPNYSLKDIIYYGMTPFGDVARAMLLVLHFFHGIVGNYGIAIIMLTVCVRGAIFPISFRQIRSMARMQALKPELDRITEKYKTDMTKRSAAMQELYRKNNINPLGGCLPVFLQIPIFMGLYRSIMIDAHLRQAPLFGQGVHWCADLSAPDMLYNWSWLMPDMVNNAVGLFGLGPYFNLLPLITVSLFFVAQKLSMPPPTNEQAAMQQKMMKYMNVFILLIFYRSPSGLCLYFIASSLWGIGERKLLAKNQPPGGPALASGPTGSPNGSPSTNRNQKSKKKR
jgi:YidC/Oxa1 family membrane protein insertase